MAGSQKRRRSACNQMQGLEFLHEAAEGTEEMTSEEQPNRHWILHEATERTEEMTFPLITRMDADSAFLKPGTRNSEPGTWIFWSTKHADGHGFGLLPTKHTKGHEKRTVRGCPRIGANDREWDDHGLLGGGPT